MKSDLWLVGIIAVILVAVCIFGVVQYVHYTHTRQVAFRTTYRVARVAAAGERIPAGTVIEPKMLLREYNGQGALVNLGLAKPESEITADNILVSDEDRIIGLKINRTVERGEELLVSYFRLSDAK